MNPLKRIGGTIRQLLKQAWSLPRTIRDSSRQRREQAALDEVEAERLDRIRCPSKYLGKP